MGFDIDALCDEIEKIYEDLLKLEIKDPSGEKKQLLDQKKLNFSINPSWLKSKGSSVRDCVLEGYGSDPKRGMVCKTSAIYTTQVSTLDIDHFFPANKIEERLNELENNKKILIAVKKKLKERKNILPNILTQLISDATPPDIKGLHTLYYNAPSNIWPMAGTVNSGKGAKDSFSEAIYVMLNSILRLYGSEHFKDIFLKNLEKCQRFSGFTINPDLSSEQLIAQITQWATDQLSNGLDEEKTILPRYLDSQTMLEKFLDSDLVTLIEGYRGQQQKIMGSAARNVTYINPENVSLSELLVFRKISRGLVKRFSGQQSSSGSSSSASDPQDDSRISSQPLDQEQLPIAFQMLGMVFESLKEDTSDEKEFITKAMSALANSIKDQKLKGTIEAAATTIQKVKVAKRNREEEDRAGLLTGYDMMSPKKFGNKSDDKHLPQENVPKVIEDSGTKRPDSAPRKRR